MCSPIPWGCAASSNVPLRKNEQMDFHCSTCCHDGRTVGHDPPGSVWSHQSTTASETVIAPAVIARVHAGELDWLSPPIAGLPLYPSPHLRPVCSGTNSLLFALTGWLSTSPSYDDGWLLLSCLAGAVIMSVVAHRRGPMTRRTPATAGFLRGASLVG